MEKYKYLILGAGPSGLSIAHTLLSHGETSFLLIEKEAVAGGLCRSVDVDGSPLDVGGGHFLDVNCKKSLDLLFRFLPAAEWQEFKRISHVCIRNQMVDYPLEANLWQLPIEDQLDFLESIAKAGCVSGTPRPSNFEDWIVWKLGSRIAYEYMLPYNRKIWSRDLNKLGIDWLNKLPDISFRETLKSCLERKTSGKIPAHFRFLYPRHFGYGEVWKRMGDALGKHLRTSTVITHVDVTKRLVNSSLKGDKIINTIPWTLWSEIAELPSRIVGAIKCLEYTSIDIDYLPDDLETPAHWIYYSEENVPFHRVLCRQNFCKGSRGYWTETNSNRALECRGWRYRNDFAYPVSTFGKPAAIKEILDWAAVNNIIGAGRWGTWEHLNSDVAVSRGIAKGLELLGTDQ